VNSFLLRQIANEQEELAILHEDQRVK